MNIPKHNKAWSKHELECDKRNRKKIVLKESGCRYVGNNKMEKIFYTYKVDGGIIATNTPKCDFLLINDDEKKSYFIELKGQNVNRAIKQLRETIGETSIKEILKNYNLHMRIISSNPPKLITEDFKVFKKEVLKINVKNSVELIRSGKEDNL